MVTNFIIIFFLILFTALSNYAKSTWLDYSIRIIGLVSLNLFLSKFVVDLPLELFIIHMLFMFFSALFILYLMKKFSLKS